MKILIKLSTIALVLFLGVSPSITAFGQGLYDVPSDVNKDTSYNVSVCNGTPDPYLDSIIAIADPYISMDAGGCFRVGDRMGLYDVLKVSVANPVVKSLNEANEFVQLLRCEGFKTIPENKAIYCYWEDSESPCAVINWWGYTMYTYDDGVVIELDKGYFPRMHRIPRV